MNEEPHVKISPDRGMESFGKSAYMKGKEDHERGFLSSVYMMLGLIFLIFVIMFKTRRPIALDSKEKEIPTPAVSREDPPLGAKLFTDRDLTNVIQRPKVNSSLLGHIRVVTLTNLSELPIGSETTAILDSGATDGIVKAKLKIPIIVDGEPLVPENSIIFGKGKSGEDRLFVEFSKMIFPSGEAFPIRAQAFDSSDKILGLKGTVISKRMKKMAGAMAFGFLGGMADGLQNNNQYLLFGQQPTMRDAALAGVGKAASNQSQAFIEEMKNSPNVVQVKAGSEIVIVIDEPKRNKEDYEK